MSLTPKELVQPKLSVVFVTKRKGASNFLFKQLAKQTFKDFEVLVSDDTLIYAYPTEEIDWCGLKNASMQKPPRKNEGDVWNLNKAYNDIIRSVKGELIVFIQDFIEIPANGLERFWDLYQLFPDDLVTGCGHKYEDGKIVETDDRCFGERALVPSDWTYYELNWASCPKHIAPKFDESMDKFYGGENQVFALNSKATVWLDRTNECKGEAHHDRPADWEENHSNKNGRLNKIISSI